MIVKPSIFNIILFGELSPWQPNKISENTFRDILNNKVRQNKDNSELFFKALIIALKDHSINLNIDHIPSIESIANLSKFADLQTDFSMLKIPEFYNKTSEFYYYLINNEIIRIKAAIASNLKKCPDIIDMEFQVVSLLKNLEYVIEQISMKNYDDRDSIYLLSAIKTALFILYEEIKIVYPEFIGSEALTVNEIINYIEPDFDANKNKPETMANSISRFIELREKLPVIVEPVNNVNLPADIVYCSFTYKHLNTQQEYIKDLYDSLKLNNLIDKASNYIDFKKIFTGDRNIKPVIWSGKISELNYFIKLIHNINKSVINLKQHQWEVACKCFIKSDGLNFERNNLKEQKKPKTTANLIEKVAAKLI